MAHLIFDLIIKNGFVIDGSGKPGEKTDLAVSGEKIVSLGALENVSAKNTIEADDLFVAPGFIDVHSHSDFTFLADPRADGKVRQGVTTEIVGHCGVSAAPMLGDFKNRRQEELAMLGLTPRWSTLKDYFTLLEDANPVVNVATLVGHGNLRAGVIGYANKPASAAEQQRMESLLEQSLDAGAFGMSTGLIYPPGVYSTLNELVALGQLVSRAGGVYATHLRSEGDRLEEALSEALLVAERTGVSLQIAHLKTYGKQNWAKLPATFQQIENAQKNGLSVHADRYPYTASCTDLDVLLPSWAWENGAENELALLTDSNARRTMTEELLRLNQDRDFWRQVVIATVKTDKNRWMEGKPLARIAEKRKQDPWDLLYDLLVEESLQVAAIFFAMSSENLAKILDKAYVMVGTDSATRSFSSSNREGRPHPRGFGTYPRILHRWAGEGNLLTWEQAIYKMTGLPARKFGLHNRGFLRPGGFADIVIFNPSRIRDRADYENPYQAPEGIEYVLINGEMVWAPGKMTGNRPGKILRKK